MFNGGVIWAVEPLRFQGFLARVSRREGAIEAARTLPGGQGVAVIPIKGVIFKDPDRFMEAFGAVSLRRIEDQLMAASADPNIGRIALLIESPGGIVDGLRETADVIRAVNKSTPITAVVDGMADSAAYYLASQAGEITAGPMDEVGSIGVRVMMYDWSKMFANEGVTPVLIDTGEFKSTGVLGMPITESQQAEIRKHVNAFFEDFKGAVRKGRKMSEEQVDKVADGRVFLGKEALRLGLIDRIAPAREVLAGLAAQVSKPRAKMAAMTTGVAKAGLTSKRTGT